MLELLRILIYYPFVNLLAFFVWLAPGHNVIWGIIALTLIVRLLLLIPTQRQAESQRKLAQINPLLEDLKREYGDDRQGLAMAQYELYRKNGINPVGSCLMGLIQIPIMFILYYAILHGLKVDSPHLYSWIPRPETISTNLFGIDLLTPDRTYILPVLAAVLQYFQMRMMVPKASADAPRTAQEDSMASMQRSMSYFFPLLTLLIAGRFPAGVAIYWIVTTLFSIVQQYFVNKKKFKIAGVKEVMEEADKEHPEYHRSQKAEKEILTETATTTTGKDGVQVTVRRKR